MNSDDTLVDVLILGFPLDIQQASNAWHDELLREFALVSLSHADSDAVPRRLLDLVERTRDTYAEFTDDVNTAQLELRSSGATLGDFHYRVPATIADACADLDAALDSSEQYCANGSLLTMRPPAVVSAFRRWLLGEFVGQIRDGAAPVPWSASLQLPGVAAS